MNDNRPIATVDERLRCIVSQLFSKEIDYELGKDLFYADFQEMYADWIVSLSSDPLGAQYMIWSPMRRTYMMLDYAVGLIIGHLCTIRNEDAPLLKNPTADGKTVSEQVRSLAIRCYNSDIKIEEAQEISVVMTKILYEAFNKNISVIGLLENGYNFDVAVASIQEVINMLISEISLLADREVVDVEDQRMPWGSMGGSGDGSSASETSGIPLPDDDFTDREV